MRSNATNFSNQLVSHRDSLQYFAFTLTKNMEDANDLVQETMLKALIYESKFKEDTNLKAWLYTIMKNIFINNYRKEKKMRLIFDGSADLYYLNIPETNKQYDPEKKMEQKEVVKKMEALQKDFQEPLKMFFEGYKYKEIADELNIPIGTVKSRIFIARKKLSDLLPDYSFSEN